MSHSVSDKVGVKTVLLEEDESMILKIYIEDFYLLCS